MQVLVLPTADQLAKYVAGYVAERLERYDTDRVNLGLAGGSTPKVAYQYLSELPVGWERVDVWLADERWVPNDHEEANARMASEHLDVPATFHFPDYSGSPHDSAASHTELLSDVLGEEMTPHIVLLGMGDDGHTASLFPGTSGLDHDHRGYVANWVDSKDIWRLTATVNLLQAADELIFIVSGANKAAALADILEGDAGDPLPSQVVAEGAENVTWLIDEAAASQLKHTDLQRIYF